MVASVPLDGPTKLPTEIVGAADAAGERRADVGVAQLQLGLLQARLLRQQIAVRLALLGRHLVELRLRCDAALNQLGLARRPRCRRA